MGTGCRTSRICASLFKLKLQRAAALMPRGGVLQGFAFYTYTPKRGSNAEYQFSTRRLRLGFRGFAHRLYSLPVSVAYHLLRPIVLYGRVRRYVASHVVRVCHPTEMGCFADEVSRKFVFIAADVSKISMRRVVCKPKFPVVRIEPNERGLAQSDLPRRITRFL